MGLTFNPLSGQFDVTGGGYTNLTEFVSQTAWRVFYSDGSGDVTELALGADGTFLKSNGAAAAPTFATPAGSGDVSKVGTPVNNQIGVWTGDGTLEGDAALTFDTATNTLATEALNLSGLTASEIVGTDASKNLVSLAVATYPSLAELAYVKGVTSAVQTQIDGKQAADAELSAIAGLTSAADKLPYFTGSGTAAVTAFTAFGRSIVDDADEATFKATVNLEIGVDVQAYSANLDEYAAVNPTAAGLALLDDATAGDQLVTLGLTATATELNYTDGVTSAIQTQLDGKQPLDTDLTTIAGLTATTDNFIVSVASAWASRTPAQVRTTLGLVIGTDVQAYDADLTTWAGITPGANVGTALAVAVGTDGAFVVKGGALGTPSSGTVTNLTGTASININGTVGATTPAAGTFTTLVAGSATSLLLGTAGSAVGSVGFRNATSGTITVSPATGALGTVAVVLPANAGTIAVSATSTTATQAMFATTTAGAPAFRAIAAGDLPSTLNAYTAGGNITLDENVSVDLDPALSADGKYSGICITGTAGATLAFGDLIYLDPTDSRWELVDANAAAGADGDARGLIGMCVLAAAADGNATKVLLQGNIRADAAFPALTVGAQVFASETAGDVTVTAPTTADSVTRVVGFALTADSMVFNPSSDNLVHV